MRRDPLTKLAVEEPEELSASQRLSRSDHGSRRSGVRVFPILDPSAGPLPNSGKRELVALSKEEIARRRGVGRADEGSYALFQVGCRSIYFTSRLLLIPPVRRLTSVVMFNQLGFAQGHISMLELSPKRTSRWGQFTSPNGQGERLVSFDITKPGPPRRQPK